MSMHTCNETADGDVASEARLDTMRAMTGIASGEKTLATMIGQKIFVKVLWAAVSGGNGEGALLVNHISLLCGVVWCGVAWWLRLQVCVDSCQGLPSKMSTNVFVSFKWFKDEGKQKRILVRAKCRSSTGYF